MIGLRDYLTMEGLVFKVGADKNAQINPTRIQEHIFNTFKGHFRGIADKGVHFDDNISKLLQNYRSAFLQLAYHYSLQKDTASTAYNPVALDERLENFNRLSSRSKALTLLEDMDREIPEAVRPIGNPDLSIQLGRMYADLGKPDELRRRLEMATSRDDLRFESLCRLAGMWVSSFGDTAKAHQILKNAMGENPSGEMLYQAGGQLFQSGAYGLAADLFEQALKIDPNDGQSVGALMQALESLGDVPRAKRVLGEWIAKHPTDNGAKRRLEQLNGRPADSVAAATPK
jgi:tetratricopeptide (TPR) repeat protein